jgi:hypothetical protein
MQKYFNPLISDLISEKTKGRTSRETVPFLKGQGEVENCWKGGKPVLLYVYVADHYSITILLYEQDHNANVNFLLGSKGFTHHNV